MSTPDDDDGHFLSHLLKENRPDTLTNEDTARLVGCFIQAKPAEIRANAFVALVAICEHWKSRPSSESETAILHHARNFKSIVEQKLSDVDEQSALEAITFMAALFAVDWQTASSIFSNDGFQDAVLDTLDLHSDSGGLSSAIASLYAQACGHKSCRMALDQKSVTWLETTFRHPVDVIVGARVTLALIKLSKGPSESEASASVDSRELGIGDADLFQKTRSFVLDQGGGLALAAEAVEGLAYLSAEPSFKERITDDEGLLSRFMSFSTLLYNKGAIPTGEYHSTLCYGLAVVVANLCTYPPRLTEEQAQLEKLRKMANTKNKDTESSIKDTDERVKARATILVKAGVVSLLSAVTRASESNAMRLTVGKAFLGLVEDKENRGIILQGGGSKVLMMIIRSFLQSSPATTSKINLRQEELFTLQALAKLAITASPLQVFGPDENTTIDAIRPLAYLLLSESSNLLQQFEALMALTNIASFGASFAERVTRFDGLMNKLEFLLLEENVMIRRAATELLCNLVAGSEAAFTRYSGEGVDDSESGGSRNAAKSRLHILVALADVDDIATRSAASGALAVLTSSVNACNLLMVLELEHRHHVVEVFKQLINPGTNQDGPGSGGYNQALLHRGVVCIRNLLTNSAMDVRIGVAKEAEKHGVVTSLVAVVKSSKDGDIPEAILQPTLEALKIIMDSGIAISL